MKLEKLEKQLLKRCEKLEIKLDKLVEKQFEIEDKYEDYENKRSYENNIDKQFEVAEELEEAKEELRVIQEPNSKNDFEDGKEIINCETCFDDDVLKEYIERTAVVFINKEDNYSEEEMVAHSEVKSKFLKEVTSFIDNHIGIDYEIEDNDYEASIQFFEINEREITGLNFYLVQNKFYSHLI